MVDLQKFYSYLEDSYGTTILPEDDFRELLDLLEAAQADAARYRWLRDEHIGDCPESINLEPAHRLVRSLDSAIDAAMSSKD